MSEVLDLSLALETQSILDPFLPAARAVGHTLLVQVTETSHLEVHDYQDAGSLVVGHALACCMAAWLHGRMANNPAGSGVLVQKCTSIPPVLLILRCVKLVHHITVYSGKLGPSVTLSSFFSSRT